MLPTPAKRLVRNLYYHDFLPRQLPEELIRSGNHLILAGETSDELDALDTLGVTKNRIFSVENNLEVYKKQLGRSLRNPGPALYHGELSDYVRHNLHQNQRFLSLNLDIYGSFWDNIDPVMTEILLFARRNPRTVVATYSSAGRDRGQLQEGLKSWAICYYLAPSETEKMVHAVYNRYRAAGLNKSVSINMVLRHMFWVRSHMEHTLRGQVAMGAVDATTAQWFFSTVQSAWQQVVGDLWYPITYSQFCHAIDRIRRPVSPIELFDIRFANLEMATYTASGRFYHIGWFCTYERGKALAPTTWLAHAMLALTAKPMWYATNTHPDALQQVVNAEIVTIDPDQVIWDDKDYSKLGRELEMPEVSPLLADLATPAVDAATKMSDAEAREHVRQLAREDPTRNTNDILAMLEYPLQRMTVTALIADVRRRENIARRTNGDTHNERDDS